MKTGVFVFFLLAFLSEMLGVVFANSGNELSQASNGSKDIQCHGYCFSVLKSLINQFFEQKHVAEDQIKKQIELITMKNKETAVQSEQIKNNANEINSLRNEIKSISEELTSTKQRLSAITEAEWCPIVNREGIFKMYIRGLNVFEAPCTKDGWMIIQKRVNGVVSFNRTWEEYKNGFGDLHGEFFIGLEKLHLITQAKTYELYIELGDTDENTTYAQYDHFEIGSEKKSYFLKSIGNYSGTAGDSLSRQNRMKFTTFDRDNDNASGNFAGDDKGGWWYRGCGYRLNGKYYKDGRGIKKMEFSGEV